MPRSLQPSTDGPLSLRRLLRLIAVLLGAAGLLALTACALGGPPPRPTVIVPTATGLAPIVPATTLPAAATTPTLPPSPSPSPLPTATLTPTPELLVLFETPLPNTLPAITLDNAAQVSGLALWYEALVSDLAWTPDGRQLAVSTQDQVHFYNLPERRIERTLYPQLPGIVDIEFSPNGRWFMVGARRGSETEGFASSLEMWTGPDWQPRGILYGTERALIDMAFSPTTHYFATAYAHHRKGLNSADLWLTSTWTISTTLETGLMQNLAFSGDGRYLAVSPDRYAIRIYDLVDKLWLFDIETSFTGAVNTMVFSPDGFTLATGHYDGLVNLWDIRTGLLVLSFETEEVIQSLAFNPNGTLLATGGSFQNDLVRLWSAGSGQLLRTLEGHTKGVTLLTFSPDGQFLVSAAYDGTMRVWGLRP